MRIKGYKKCFFTCSTNFSNISKILVTKYNSSSCRWNQYIPYFYASVMYSYSEHLPAAKYSFLDYSFTPTHGHINSSAYSLYFSSNFSIASFSLSYKLYSYDLKISGICFFENKEKNNIYYYYYIEVLLFYISSLFFVRK